MAWNPEAVLRHVGARHVCCHFMSDIFMAEIDGDHYVWTGTDIRLAGLRDYCDLLDDRYCHTEGMHAARTGVML